MNLLGIRIDNLSKKELLEKVGGFLNSEKFHQIATINPEFILAAQKNLEFKNILNNCDLNVADGFGIKLAFWRFGETLKARATGIDLMQEILQTAQNYNLKIFLVANSRGLSTWEETAQSIMKHFPKLELGGINLDYKNPNEIQNSKFKIKNSENYDVIFCNFGAPHQEKFLNSLKTAENSKIRLAMGVGGSFDYLTGKIIRAPKLMRQSGLEWLWRLIQQPRRIKRIWNSVIIFPLKVIFNE